MTLSIWLPISIIFVLLIVSAFFSASETALTAASRAKLFQLRKKGSKSAATVQKLQENMEKLIGTILFGNTLVNIFASAIATGFLVKMFGETGIAYATVGMTLLILFFSEILPKMGAVNHPETAARHLAPILKPFIIVFSPIATLIQWLAGLTWKIFGVRIGKDKKISAGEEELRGTIELHRETDSVALHKGAMLKSILDLTTVTVSEVMVHRKTVKMIDASDPSSLIVEKISNSPYTRLPLWKDNPENIVGMLHAKHVLKAVRTHKGKIDSLNIISLARKPWFVPESTTLLAQLQDFRNRHEHLALVVDEYGELQGIITLEDILEEIVGEISDEHDVDIEGVHLQGDGTYLVNGIVTIRDLNRQFDWELPDEEASTIAGLALYEFQKIPKVGQSVELKGFKLEILRRYRNQITLVKITTPIKSKSEEDG